MNLFCVEPDALLLLHEESLGEQGSAPGPCDDALLEAALSHPLDLAVTRAVDIADVAAAYACGILRYRPFAVGNERVALLAMGLFLYLNEWRLDAPPHEAADVIWQVSGAILDETGLANWVRSYL